MRIHSWLSPACAVRPSPVGGLGVFAVRDIPAGAVVTIWGGRVFTAAEVDELAATYPRWAATSVTVWDDVYVVNLSPDDPADDTELINHSCDPNAGVVGQIVLLARRPIAAGAEVTFDYDTTETSPLGGFECRCGSRWCRGVIDGSAWTDAAFRERNRGWLSAYLAARIAREVG